LSEANLINRQKAVALVTLLFGYAPAFA